MSNMDKRVTFVQKVQEAVTMLAQVNDKVATLEKAYFDRAYNAKASSEITDPDIQPHTQVSVADLTSAITLLSQFKAFCNNQAVIQGDYSSTLNKVRNDF
jgi:hypothetical protein